MKKLSFLIGSKDLYITKDKSNKVYSIYVDSDTKLILFILMIPIISNIIGLIWWLSSLSRSIEFEKEEKEKVCFSTQKKPIKNKNGK